MSSRAKRLKRETDRSSVFTGAFQVSVLQVVCTHVQEHKYAINTHACTHTNECDLSAQPHSNPHGLKPRSPHNNEATPILHHGRCVAVATRPFHLMIDYWVCIFRLPPLPRKPVNHTFISSFPSDWLVPLVPSFKVLTFIHNWLPNDNQ